MVRRTRTVSNKEHYQEPHSNAEKPIIDEIDQHYGFTADELDFIINYDIRYRMGKDNESDD